MGLVSISSDGRILLTLKHGKHTYSELKLETGLSDRWLTVKLKELASGGLVCKSGRWYGLASEPVTSAYELSLYMISQARRVAGGLSKLGCVEAIILFGSVARKEAHEHSDLDLLIVVNEEVDKVRRQVISEVSRLEQMYHFGIEPLILTKKDFADNIHPGEVGLVYGVAEGFEVLLDKTGHATEILRASVEEIRRTHEYLKDVRIWLRVR